MGFRDLEQDIIHSRFKNSVDREVKQVIGCFFTAIKVIETKTAFNLHAGIQASHVRKGHGRRKIAQSTHIYSLANSAKED